MLATQNLTRSHTGVAFLLFTVLPACAPIRGGRDEVMSVARAMKVCPCLGCSAHDGSCPQIVPSGRCDRCANEAERRRGTATQRGYTGRAHTHGFRLGVLRKHPLCQCDNEAHGHGPRCYTPSTVADHHPRDRRELARLGLNPDHPQYGRGLCKTCHDRETAANQPGGWNAR